MEHAPARPARIILDANMLVSAVIVSGRAGRSELGLTVDRALGSDVTVITCPRLLAEVERTLRTSRLARWVVLRGSGVDVMTVGELAVSLRVGR